MQSDLQENAQENLQENTQDPWQTDIPDISSLNSVASNNDAFFALDTYAQNFMDYLSLNYKDSFSSVKLPIDFVLKHIETLLVSTNAWVLGVIFCILIWRLAGLRLAIFGAFGLLLIASINAWTASMITLALVITAVSFSVIIGIPLGILSAKSRILSAILRPILDAMQTTPSFVYLIPIVMLFDIGNTSGVIATSIFATPSLIRLTELGINQIPKDLKEASLSFGASPWQILLKLELPLSKPSIMAGINQTIMLSLSMVVIASMIGVGGLGQMVLRGIGRLDMGLASVGAISIIVLAITLDRLTQKISNS